MHVEYVDHMGSDLSVVNAARVSFNKRSDVLGKSDKHLIAFLARGCRTSEWEDLIEEAKFGTPEEVEGVLRYVKSMPTHWTPFGHTAVTLHVKAPIFVARQLGKHQVGLVWNEVSRRYVDEEPELFIPKTWRARAKDVKQGSSDDTIPVAAEDIVRFNDSVQHYDDLLRRGVAPEEARMVLPQAMYTEWYWTGNIYAFANICIQRRDSHAQSQTREIARMIDHVIRDLFPVSWRELTK